jgi:signal transduction histidine kinase
MSLMLLAYPAVLVAAFVGGLLSGIVALVATALGLAYFTIEPVGSFLIAAERDALDLALFCVIGLSLVAVVDRRTQALRLAKVARAQAEEASAAKEAVMAVVAHDLRNPLQTVTLTAALLAPKLEGDPRAMNMLERMRRSVEHACVLVDASLEWARPGDPLLRVKQATWPLRNMIDDLCGQFEPLASARGVSLERPTDVALEGSVWCDKERILQVLGNLVGNALKFTPSGGTVRIDVGRDAEGIRFTVIDTGCGMAPEELAHCFERCWHGATPGHGTGLGLWISKTLVEAHGGQLVVHSEREHGTTMTFVLPPPPDPTDRKAGRRVLLRA